MSRLLEAARQARLDPVSVSIHLMAPDGTPCPNDSRADSAGDATVQVIVEKFCDCSRCRADPLSRSN
jgi:hypothetical protein